MSRFIKKIRKTKKTREIFGEGREDKTWLSHLKSLYSRNSDYFVKIDCGAGGSPVDVVDAAIRKSKADEVYVVVDKDRPEQELLEARSKAKLHGIELIEIELCMESMLINIIESEFRKVKDAKTYFETNYIGAKKRRDREAYAKKFPKSLLDKRRKTIKELDKIIRIIEGK